MAKQSPIQARLVTPAAERELVASATPKGVVSPIPPVRSTVAPNHFWDDAQSMYSKSIGAIQQTHGQLSTYLQSLTQSPTLMAKVTDVEGLVANIRLMTRDIAEHIDRLNGIYARHRTRTGGTQTPDDHMNLIQIHGLYADAVDIHNNVIMPTVSHIFEQIGIAQDLLDQELAATSKAAEEAQAAEQAALVDPSVISDVAVKDVQAA